MRISGFDEQYVCWASSVFYVDGRQGFFCTLCLALHLEPRWEHTTRSSLRLLRMSAPTLLLSQHVCRTMDASRTCIQRCHYCCMCMQCHQDDSVCMLAGVHGHRHHSMAAQNAYALRTTIVHRYGHVTVRAITAPL